MRGIGQVKAALDTGTGGLQVVAALAGWNLGNFLFFVIAGRLLGPEDYGLVAALLGVTMIVFVPASAFQYAMARQAAIGSQVRRAAALYRFAWSRVALASAAFAVVTAGVALAFDQASDLPLPEVLLTIAVVAPMGVLLMSLGWLQGRGRFGPFSWSLGLLGALRPPALLMLALVVSGVYAALGASALITVGIAWLAWHLTRPDTRHGDAAELRASWRSYLGALPPLALGFAGLAALTNLDIVAAKILLDDRTAGHFGAAAILAKGLLLLPQALAVVLLPRIARRRADGLETASLMGRAIAIVLVGGLAGVFLFALIGGWLVDVTYGAKFAPAADLLVPFALATTLLGVVVILINDHAARGRNPYVIAVALVALAQPLLFALLNSSPEALILVDAIVYAAAIVIHEVMQARRSESVVASLWELARQLAGTR